jgi:hypothetical protein
VVKDDNQETMITVKKKQSWCMDVSATTMWAGDDVLQYISCGLGNKLGHGTNFLKRDHDNKHHGTLSLEYDNSEEL